MQRSTERVGMPELDRSGRSDRRPVSERPPHHSRHTQQAPADVAPELLALEPDGSEALETEKR